MNTNYCYAYKSNGSSHDAHDEYIVHRQADVLGVVQRWDGHVTSLPCQERSEYLEISVTR